MYKIDDPTCSASEPALPTDETVTPGWFTEGNAASATAPTRVRGWWLNMVQDELASIVAAASIAFVKGTNNQVLAALHALFMPRGQTLSSFAQTIFTPAGNTVSPTSYPVILTFTSTVPGVIYATAHINVSTTQGVACGHYLSIDGVALPADQCTGSMSHSGGIAVGAGLHTVESIYGFPAAVTGSISSVGQTLSYIFVPD